MPRSGTSAGYITLYADLQFSSPPVLTVAFQVSTLFDFLVVVLTYRSLSLEHFQGRGHKSSSFTGVLWSSSLVYFLITTVFNIANVVLYGVFSNSNATILGPMGIAITSMMSSRVSTCTYILLVDSLY